MAKLNPKTHGYEIVEAAYDQGGLRFYTATAYAADQVIAHLTGRDGIIAPMSLRKHLETLMTEAGWTIRQRSFLDKPEPRPPRTRRERST